MALRISIVIPNYNSGAVLERAILSLTTQNYPNLQLIMMDAVSNDESSKIIERYRDVFDVVVIDKDKGQADALNKGFARADGEIFGWLCADDEMMPGALAAVGDYFQKNADIDMLTGACERVFADGARLVVPPDPRPWDRIGIQNVIEQSATFWRAALHRKAGPISMSYNLCFDWDLWNRFKKSGARIDVTAQLFSRYYFSASNKTGTAGRQFAHEAFVILRKYGPLGGLLAYIFRFLYQQFDLHGCYDNPPRCTLLRSHLFIWSLAALRGLIGQKRLYLYNWHFASCQERGLKWW